MHLEPQEHTGSWLAHQSISTFPPSRNFLEKELILTLRYLPHPNSDSADFFLLGIFPQGIQIYYLFLKILYKNFQICSANSWPKTQNFDISSLYIILHFDHLCSDTM